MENISKRLHKEKTCSTPVHRPEDNRQKLETFKAITKDDLRKIMNKMESSHCEGDPLAIAELKKRGKF